MPDVVIKVENLSKRYRLGTVGTGTLSHDLNRWWHRLRGKADPYMKVTESNDRVSSGDSDYVWALRDINLDVKQGEVLGIIGANGAGKSTLLKILSRVTAPTDGTIKVRGRIGSLLEVGTGFHPELTGRENVFLNGAILGMAKFEIASRLDDIVDFSGCERYINTPVKRYSSGMLVRLAFSVAAHLDPEILIVDEVLAVGDVDFQKRCIGKMKDVAGDGRTVLFVSHNMASIEALCSRAVLIEDGSVKADGSRQDVVSEYLSSWSSGDGDGQFVRAEETPGVIREVRVRNAQGSVANNIKAGEPVTFSLRLRSTHPLLSIVVGLHIEDDCGRIVTSLHSRYHPSPVLDVSGEAVVECLCESLMLTAGHYCVTVAVIAPSGETDTIKRCLPISVVEADVLGTGRFPPLSFGVVISRGQWRIGRS